MFIEITKAEYIKDYQIKIWFNNGEVKVVDLKNNLKGKVFEPLNDIDYFKSFHLAYNTIEWENGADFAPEFLYEM